MFVNNYYVGDNSWRPGVTEGKTKTAQQIDASTNRSNMAVQTVGVSRGYTDYHQGRAIHMADSRIH